MTGFENRLIWSKNVGAISSGCPIKIPNQPFGFNLYESLNIGEKTFMETQPQSIRRVPPGSPLFPNKPRLSKEQIAQRKAESHAFAERCRAIFNRVAPQLMADHYDWSIHIEPDSGDYFIDPDSEICYQKARLQHPTKKLMEMCLNETGACGRI